MENPWLLLPNEQPYVLPGDAAALEAIVGRARQATRPHIGLLPEPFVGHVGAPVVFLDSHPGVDPEDERAHADPEFQAALRASLDPTVRSDWPVFSLAPRFRTTTPAGRYNRALFGKLVLALQSRLGGTEEEAWRRLANSVLLVRLFPYHRLKTAPGQKVPSQEFGIQLVRAAIEREALIVFRYAESAWLERLPALRGYDRKCVVKSAITGAITAGNLPGDWFDRVVDALLEANVASRVTSNQLAVDLPDDLSNSERTRVVREIEAIVRDARLRRQVIAAWGPACAVCGLELISPGATEECEVAHVVPVADGGPDEIENALPLCRTHHWAFDQHLWALDPSNDTIYVREGYREHSILKRFHGERTRAPQTKVRLAEARLRARWEAFRRAF